MASRPYVANSAFVPISHGCSRSPAIQHSVNDHRRRTWYGSPTAPVTDYEVNNYLSSGIPKSLIYHHSRKTGVSPVFASHPSVPRWFPSSGIRGLSLERSKPSPSYSREALAPYEDVVVGVAHTSQYGDIVIGIPYHKRFMFNTEQNDCDIKDNNYYSKPHFVNRYSTAENGPYQQSSVSIEPSYRRASISGPYSSSFDDIDYISASPYNRLSRKPLLTPPLNSSYYRPSRKIVTSDDEYDDFPLRRPTSTVSNLNTRSHSAGRNFNIGSEFYTSSNIGNLVQGSHRTTYVTPLINSTSSAEPGAERKSTLPPRPPKLPLSEARRKVRNLLCKSKNDPTYYED